MPLLSPLRSRRLAQQQQLRNQQKLITFEMGSHWFALPLALAERVLDWQELAIEEGSPRVSYQNRSISLVDPGLLLLGKSLQAPPQALILLNAPAHNVGLPIPSQPLLRRLPSSEIQPFPDSYAAQARQRGLAQWIPASTSHTRLLVLDPGILNLAALGPQG